MSIIIKAKNLSCNSGKQFLLHDINWEVKEGEHWLIFGMNGSGKTTLLSMIAGFKVPSAGNLEVLGQSFNKETIFNLRRQIGWVSSSFFDKYYHHEIVLQIVLSGLFGTFNIDYTVTDQEVRRAKALLCALRLEDKINLPFDFLSKGERQNVLIARALINNPKILVLDEPGTGLDVLARAHMQNTVASLAKNGKVTILYVTHYLEEVQNFMGKTLLLRNGCVFSQGDTAQVLTKENLSRLLGEDVSVKHVADGSMTLQLTSYDSGIQLQ